MFIDTRRTYDSRSSGAQCRLDEYARSATFRSSGARTIFLNFSSIDISSLRDEELQPNVAIVANLGRKTRSRWFVSQRGHSANRTVSRKEPHFSPRCANALQNVPVWLRQE
jgi:hypothetical protein